MFNRSLDNILGAFSKVQRDLETYIDAENAKNVKDQETIVKLSAGVDARASEIERASLSLIHI